MLVAIKRELDQLLADERQGHDAAAQVKCGFRNHRLAGQQRLSLILNQADRPIVIPVIAADEGDQKAGVSNAFH